MKLLRDFIKNNWLLLAIIVIVMLLYIFVHNHFVDVNKKVGELEKEKTALKKQVADKEIEIRKIRVEKDEIVKKYHFSTIKHSKLIEDYENLNKVKQKTIIQYKTKIITKDTPQDELWTFGKNVYLDFSAYRKLDIKENLKTDKIIKDLKLINVKSEKIINYKDVYIKKLKKTKKKIIIGAVLTVLGILLIK